MSRPRRPFAKRLVWFVLLWAAGVATVGAVAAVLKMAIGS